MKKRTPQEKKKLSYERDRRNVYGESPHAARKAIPLHKALRNRANRHGANKEINYRGPTPEVDLADELESRIYHRAPQEWEKYPDAPLGEVVDKKSRKRDHAETRWARGVDHANACQGRGLISCGTRPNSRCTGARAGASYERVLSARAR